MTAAAFAQAVSANPNICKINYISTLFRLYCILFCIFISKFTVSEFLFHEDPKDLYFSLLDKGEDHTQFQSNPELAYRDRFDDRQAFLDFHLSKRMDEKRKIIYDQMIQRNFLSLMEPGVEDEDGFMIYNPVYAKEVITSLMQTKSDESTYNRKLSDLEPLSTPNTLPTATVSHEQIDARFWDGIYPDAPVLTRRPTIAPTKQPLIPTREVDALWELYNTTEGYNWRWQNNSQYGELTKPWDFSESPIDPCGNYWEGK
jgi:hypothetical protein